MKKATIFIIVAFVSLFSYSQTTIVSQGFESSSSDTWNFTANPVPYIESSGTDVWSPIKTMLGIKDPYSGTFYWGMRDLRNGGSGGDFDHTLQFDEINVSGQSDLLISFLYNTVNYGFTDYIKVEFFFDGISQGVEQLHKNTREWKLYSKAIPNGTSKVSFTLIARQNGSTEYAGLDSIILQSGANTLPNLTIDSPSQGVSIPINSSGFEVEFFTTNFTLSEDNGSGSSDNSGDGYIIYTIDGSQEFDHFGNLPINIIDIADGNHTIKFHLVNNNGSDLNPKVETSLSFNSFSVIQSLPFSESFDYPVGETLDEQDNWLNTGTGDDVIISPGNLSYPGLESSKGKSISFDGSGADPYIEFETVSTGVVYSSFIFKVTNIDALNDRDGGHFALLRNGKIYESRIWLKKADFNSFYIGMSTGPVGNFSSQTFKLDTPIFLVLNYDLSSGTSSLWVNPDPAKPAPTSTLSYTSTPAASLDNFLIRQFSSSDTPFIILDELKLGSNWGEVTNTILSTTENEFEPTNSIIVQNPIQNGLLQFSQIDNGLKVDIFNVLGHKTLSVSPDSEKIDISHLSTGVYLAQFYRDSKIVGFEKIIIQ